MGFSKKQGITPKYSRRPGTKVSYTDEQTARYKSRQARLTRAAEILSHWDERVTEIQTDSGRTLYLLASDRATNGYWSVVVDEDQEPPEPPIVPPLPPEQPPTTGNPPPTRNTVYTAYLAPGSWRPGLPPGLKATASTFYLPQSSIPLPWLSNERWEGQTIVDSIYGANGPRVESLDNFDDATLNQLETDNQPYWLRNIKIYFLQTPTGTRGEIVLLYRYQGPNPAPQTYELGTTSFQYNPQTYTTPLELRGSADNFSPAYPLGYDPDAPPGSGAPSSGEVPPIEPTPPDDPPRANYSCNCPDYLRIELMDPNSDFPSRWSDREWIDSDAGSDGDCKHILAVKLKRGDPVE